MGDDVDDPLLLHLRDLPAATSEEELAGVLEALWKTRKTGLDATEKSRVQSLLGLSTPERLDPILACLRLIIRKFLREKLTEYDVRKLLLPHASVELQSILVLLLQKYHSQWMEEASPPREQPHRQQTRESYQVKVNSRPALASFPASELLSSMWSRQDNASTNSSGVQHPDISNVGRDRAEVASMPLHQDSSFRDLTTVPRLKSMTWTMQNKNSKPANRVAIVTLKLQDYTKSTGEIEVKFELSKDTLEAMLRSMTQIREKLSNAVAPSSEPSAKRQKQ